MFIRKIKLENYRNHRLLEIQDLAHINFITGPNASGKSNIMEAILRFNAFNKHKNSAIRLGDNQATVQIEVEKAGTSAKHILVAQKHQEEVRISRKQPLGNLPIVYFMPQEDDIFGGSPQERRHFLDTACSLFKKAYGTGLLEYQRVVRQKNDILKGNRQPNTNLLATYNQQLVQKAEELIRQRLWLLKNMEPVLRELYCKLTGSPVAASVEYLSRTSEGDIRGSLSAQLQQKAELELVRGCCLVGPHRDDFSLVVDGVDVATLGSQGEKRTGCLALKIALINMLQHEGTKPLLILDDALSELDDNRRQLLLGTVGQCEQVFITATDADNLKLGDSVKIFELGLPQ